MKTTLNFGALKDTITKKAGMEMLQENKNSTLSDFMTQIRKNPILKKQYLIYKNFEKTKPFEHARLAERFITQNMEAMKQVGWQQLMDENAKMRQNLLGGPDECTVMARTENQELFENVSTLIESTINPMFKDFDKDAKAYGALVEHLTRKMPEMNEEKERPETSKLWRFVAKNALGYFNERYEALDEEERELFGVLISEAKEKKEKVSRMREDLISLVETKMEKASDNREDVIILESFRDKLKKDVDDAMLTSDEYVMACFELKKTIEER